MEEGIDANMVLDCVVFQTSSIRNRYEALICCEGKTEKLDSGPLDQLAFHLPEAKQVISKHSSDSFKLQINDSRKHSSWFTKATLSSFLQLVNATEVLKVANTIENEISQLEDARRFHLNLYAEDNGGHSGDATTDMYKQIQMKDTTASPDATKNELLRAMDLRLLSLKEELVATFNQAAGAAYSVNKLSDLAEFSQHFRATTLKSVILRISLLKLVPVEPKDQPANSAPEQSAVSDDPRDIPEDEEENISPVGSQIDIVKPVGNSVSPAKLAQAERQSSTESEESSDSTDEDRSFSERSRPLIRSTTPRRSASPMRRIQIGRSGSRRSAALTIKSLNYFPIKERTSSNRDSEGNNSGVDESNQPTKKPESTVRRMSVQDAISLFESKQKDQNLNIQKKRTPEVSSGTNKSVLRRWSAGMGDSFNHCSQECASDTSSHTPEPEKKAAEVRAESGHVGETLNPVENAQVSTSSGAEELTCEAVDNPVDFSIPMSEKINDRATASAEWNQQKEAELNQMLMKMVRSKPGKYQGCNPVGGEYQDISSEQRGGFYSQYKEKRDEKLRAENAGKRAVKEAQFKVMQQTLQQSKAEMVSKSGGVKGKQDSRDHSQRPRRNSSSPVLTKKDPSKPVGMKKASQKTSPMPTTRSSWSSGPSLRTTGTPQTKTASNVVSTGTTPNRRKSQPAPSPNLQSRTTPIIEKPVQQPKAKRGTLADVKPSLKNHESKLQKSVTKTNKTVKTKDPPSSEGDSTVPLVRPSLYSKVTKKSSVVPLESKPFLKKRTGIGAGVGAVPAKTKVPQSNESSKDSGNLIQAEGKEYSTVPAESTTLISGKDLVQHLHNVDENLDSQNHDMNLELMDVSQSSAVDECVSKNPTELPVPEIQPDGDLVISSAAWVEVPSPGVPTCENGMPEIAESPGFVPVPRVRHSLSQMLQADSCEPEISEWGNAENPPALVYQKDSPKGLMRLLKFARKSKGDANATGSASPSVFSEGEEDQEESKTTSKRSSDSLLRKATLQYGQQQIIFSEGFDGGNSSKRTMDNQGMPHIFSAQPKATRDGQTSDAASMKATRSFFSLSTLRSSKSSEAKLR